MIILAIFALLIIGILSGWHMWHRGYRKGVEDAYLADLPYSGYAEGLRADREMEY